MSRTESENEIHFQIVKSLFLDKSGEIQSNS